MVFYVTDCVLCIAETIPHFRLKRPAELIISMSFYPKVVDGVRKPSFRFYLRSREVSQVFGDKIINNRMKSNHLSFLPQAFNGIINNIQRFEKHGFSLIMWVSLFYIVDSSYVVCDLFRNNVMNVTLRSRGWKWKLYEPIAEKVLNMSFKHLRSRRVAHENDFQKPLDMFDSIDNKTNFLESQRKLISQNTSIGAVCVCEHAFQNVFIGLKKNGQQS